MHRPLAQFDGIVTPRAQLVVELISRTAAPVARNVPMLFRQEYVNSRVSAAIREE